MPTILLNPARDEGRRRRDALTRLWRTRAEWFVILMTDIDTGLHFVQCRPKRRSTGEVENVVAAFRGKAAARKVMRHPAFASHWVGYSPRVERYEALREFEDTHRRVHWRFVTEVLFAGSIADMDYISTLTIGSGQVFDGERGLYLPDGKGLTLRRPHG